MCHNMDSNVETIDRNILRYIIKLSLAFTNEIK